MNPAPILHLSKLTCSRGGRQLFKDVDCSLSAGQWLYVSGANGVGKTTLLRTVCGLSPSDAGEVRYLGEPILAQRDSYHLALCYLGHQNGLHEGMSVAENLRYAMALAHMPLHQAPMQAALERFGLKGRSGQLVRHLSQGQKRRVALARLALCRARLWVLDEPYVAMDEAGIALLAGMIEAHLQAGGLAIITSHQRVAIGSIEPRLLELSA